MDICGAEIKGSDLIILPISAKDGKFVPIQLKSIKIPLGDSSKQDEVRRFYSTLRTYVTSNNVQKIILKARSSGGPFRGGSEGFKIEAIMQILNNCDVVIISAQTIAARKKREGTVAPSGILKYQEEAYFAGWAYLVG